MTQIRNAISALILLSLAACQSMPPKVDITLWAGDPKNDGVTRSQDHVTLKCSDPGMDDMVALSYVDLKKLLDTVWACQQWPTGIEKMNKQDAEKAITLYSLIARKSLGATQ